MLSDSTDCVFRSNEAIEVSHNGALSVYTTRKSVSQLDLLPSFQFPGSFITSLGAEVQVEKTCFNPSAVGQYLSPILLAGDGDAADFTDGGDNYVEGTWDCPLIGDFAPDPSVGCGAAVADETSCQASNSNFVVFW